jgi:YesN/AraC family two-component response regulator
MDIIMPIMDGIEASELILAHDSLKHIPIIVLSANIHIDNEEKIKKISNDILIKPVDEQTILNVLCKFIPYKIKKRQSKLSPDKKQKIKAEKNISPELKNDLKSIQSQIISMKGFLEVDRLKIIREDISAKGKEHHHLWLTDWAKRFAKNLKNYDVEKIDFMLNELSAFIKDL